MIKYYPCPCCGHLVHDGGPGSHLICPICYWEDDLVQLRWPLLVDGANRPSLMEAQKHYRNAGVSEGRFANSVRRAAIDEPIDEGFRPIDLAIDNFEVSSVQDEPWPGDRTDLYWWRPTYWRRSKGGADR
jgi:Cysteine-rich CPCC